MSESHLIQMILDFEPGNYSYRVVSAYFFLISILITGSAHTDREKVSTKSLIILIKALNEG